MIFKNPETIHKPLSSYSHQAEASPNAKWLVMSGQIGMDKNGFVPENVFSQMEIALDNIISNLEASGMDIKNLVKLIFYFVGQHDGTQRRSIISRRLSDHQPCMTVIFVAGLAHESYKVEIDAWACSE